MAAASRLGRQLEEVIASLSKVDARFALIGGLALASHKVIRATQDIDLLTDSEKAEVIDRELIALGYTVCIAVPMPETTCAVMSAWTSSTPVALRRGACSAMPQRSKLLSAKCASSALRD